MQGLASGADVGDMIHKRLRPLLRRTAPPGCSPLACPGSGGSFPFPGTWKGRRNCGRCQVGESTCRPVIARHLKPGRCSELADHVRDRPFGLKSRGRDETGARNPDEESRPSRGVCQMRDHRTLDLVESGAVKAPNAARAALSTVLNQRAFSAGDGVADQEGTRRVDGHPHADAEQP